jgi:hypothetical protein
MYAYINEPGKEGIVVKSSASGSWQKMDGTSKLPSSPLGMIAINNDLFISAYTESVWSTKATTQSVTGRGEEASLLVYPNPARDRVTISLPGGSEVMKVELIDVAGRVVLSNFLRSGEVLRLTNIPGGIYVLKAGNSTTKIVVE